MTPESQTDSFFFLWSRRWFQICVIFTPKIGEDSHFDEHIFQRGWFNHQLVHHFIGPLKNVGKNFEDKDKPKIHRMGLEYLPTSSLNVW